ncbi:hypothetical protein [Burkholderia stabilis]|nr:hypothetical protein [Burkholderia stabilis]
MRAVLGESFHAVFAAVSDAMKHTPRSSSRVENLIRACETTSRYAAI